MLLSIQALGRNHYTPFSPQFTVRDKNGKMTAVFGKRNKQE